MIKMHEVEAIIQEIYHEYGYRIEMELPKEIEEILFKRLEEKLYQELKDEIGNAREIAVKLGRKIRTRIVKILDEIGEPREDYGYNFYDLDDRFFAFVTPVTRKKKTSRICQKLRNTVIGSKMKKELYPNWEKAKNDPWRLHINDLARFRIVCCYLNDLYFLACRIGEELKDNLLKGEQSLKDYILGERPNKRANAAKSIHFRFLLDDKYRIELQIMTLLHFGWDQIEHPRFERRREGIENLQKDLQYWAASDALYLIDEHLMSLEESTESKGRKINHLLSEWNQLVSYVAK